MTAEPVRVSADWLALREPADAAARAADLVERAAAAACRRTGAVIHDLGCGTGSMGRWLAPRLTGPQHWIMYDRDADLLAHAAADMPAAAADGCAGHRRDPAARHHPADARPTWPARRLITASALLDMLTADELDRFVTACAGAGCPALVTLSVIGRVELTPADPLDASVADAFNAHQRRTTGGRQPARPGRGRRRGRRVHPARRRRASCGPARGGSARPRPRWPRSGSPAGSARRASSDRS